MSRMFSKKKLTLLSCGFCLTACADYFCGFETEAELKQWNASKPDMQYSLAHDVFHSGTASLQIADNDTGKESSSLYRDLPVKKYAGRSLLLSAWIRQKNCSVKNGVRIQFQWRTRDGLFHWKYAGVPEKGEIPWNLYEVRADIPNDIASLRISLMCAQGRGAAGHAWFDDVRLETVGKGAPAEQASAGSSGNNLFAVGKSLPQGWKLTDQNADLLCEFRQDPRSGIPVIRLTGKRENMKGPAFHFTGALNRRLNIGGKTVIRMKPAKQCSLFGIKVRFEKAEADGWSTGICRIPEKYRQETIRFKFDEPVKKGETILIGRITFESFSIDRNFSPAVKAELDQLLKPKPFNEAERPEIRHGTFHMNGRPRFLSGPWISNVLITRDYAKPLPFLKDPIYTTSFNEAIGKRFKMESVQLSSITQTPFLLEAGWPVDANALRELKGNRKFYTDMGKMPFTQDYAWINNLPSRVKEIYPEQWRELEQQNRDWHEFVPFCPEHPIGGKLYRDLYRTGTEYTVRSGGNVYLHELFNEPNYMCFCRFNRENFLNRLRKKYGTVKRMNETIGTTFKSFDEISSLSHYRGSRGLWVEWCKFIGDRYAEILRELGGVVRGADGRKNTYITEMCSAGNIYFGRGAGMDFRKNAETIDVLGVEGGWTYGTPRQATDANPMLDVLYLGSHDLVLDFYAALGKGKKPVINLEHYCRRVNGTHRVPSRPEDIISSLWREIFHGSSGAHFYAWERRAWLWNTFEEAKKLAESSSVIGANLLNPYAYPLETLKGFRIFQEELEPLRDLVLPFPRFGKRNVAMIYSYPAFRLSPLTNPDFGARLKACYSALQRNHYAMQIVFEEELSLERLMKFDAVVLPSLRNSYANTRELLLQYLKAGKPLVWAADSLSEDEYGRPIGREKFREWKNSYFSPVSFGNPAGAAFIAESLKKADIFREFTINHAATELTCITRNDQKILLIFNQLDEAPRILTLRCFSGRQSYVRDPIEKQLYLSPSGKEFWSESELKQGISVPVHGQVRRLLLFSAQKPEQLKAVNAEQLKRSLEISRKAYEKANSAQEAIRRQNMDKSRRERTFDKIGQCRTINLDRWINGPFHDEIPGDGKGGWTDQGSNDFRTLKPGLHTLCGGIPFLLGNGGIFLKSKNLAWRPEKVSGISINDYANNLYILHTAAFSQKKGTPVYYLTMFYADGTSHRATARYGIAISDWFGHVPMTEARTALESPNQFGRLNTLFAWKIKNPNPLKKIVSVDVLSADNACIPAILAITLETQKKELKK